MSWIERLISRIEYVLANLRNRLRSWRMGRYHLFIAGHNSYYNGRHFSVSCCPSCNGTRFVISTFDTYKICKCLDYRNIHYTGYVYGNGAIAFKLKQLGIKS